jgi:septal ring factor EnvC (AmiA/AmiB activator)
MQELKGLLHDILRKEAKGSCPACGADVNDRLKLEVQLHKTTENFEKLERNLKKMTDEGRSREDELRGLMSKLSVTELQLKAAEEDRDTLRSDLENSEAGRSGFFSISLLFLLLILILIIILFLTGMC